MRSFACPCYFGNLMKGAPDRGTILSAMEEAREQLLPFMSDLNDIKKLLESELSATSVASTQSLIPS